MLIILGANGGLGHGLSEYLKLNAKKAVEYGQIVVTTRAEIDFESEPSFVAFFSKIANQISSTEPLYIVSAVGVSLNNFCHKMSLHEFEKTLAVNLTGAFLLLKHSHPLLKTRPGSSILLLSSVVGEIGVPGTIAYAASKAGLRGLVRTGAKELARLNVTLNAIELGYFETGMIKQVPESHMPSILSQIPLERLGSIEDLAKACQFALQTGFLTGSTIKLNGGMI